MKKVGVLGGGQLARMLALAGYPLGIQILCYEPTPHTCANQVTQVIQKEYTDESALREFAKSVDVITFETENIPLHCAEFLAKHVEVLPSITALKSTQDRISEKKLLQSLNIPTAQFSEINSWEDVKNAVEKFNFPGILKTTRNGYDGKGQAVIRDWESAKEAWEKLQKQTLIFESFIPFEYEVSLISVRSRDKKTLFYPLVTNDHKNGILRISKAPFVQQDLQKKAEDYALRLMDQLDYVGIMTIEFFVKKGELIANEIAPRVHNSGHWTIEGAVTSQFENHLRALCDLPLGETKPIGFSAMYNLIGTEPNIEKVLAISGAHYHHYGKEARPERKVGHITLNYPHQAELEINLGKLVSIIRG